MKTKPNPMEDLMENNLEKFKTPKPTVQLNGEDGNVFGIIGRVSKALKRAGMPEEAIEFTTKAFACHSYDDVLQLCFAYVEVA
jgi:hypothetical protein